MQHMVAKVASVKVKVQHSTESEIQTELRQTVISFGFQSFHWWTLAS